MPETLTVCEIFKSIEGETSYAGLPCAFVRTSGCNLECAYCDTSYARTEPGREMSVGDICEEVLAFGTRLACITGGEPLLQREPVTALAERLLKAGLTVLVETNGTQDISRLPRETVCVMDVKCPGSGESGGLFAPNVAQLGPRDETKFVITDRRDFDWALSFVREHDLWGGPEILFAPAHGFLEPVRLADWVLESRANVRLNLQLHRLLWPGRERGV